MEGIELTKMDPEGSEKLKETSYIKRQSLSTTNYFFLITQAGMKDLQHRDRLTAKSQALNTEAYSTETQTVRTENRAIGTGNKQTGQ